MTEKQVLKYLGLALMMLPFLSMFLWAGLNVKWWATIESAGDVRILGLGLIHGATFLFGLMLFKTNCQEDR